MLELKNSKTTELLKAKDGRRRFAVDGFIGAVQMLDPLLGWQDIKPRLVRDTDGWHVEGAPYYAEVKDNGDRLFCPDKYERSKYIRLPNIPLFSGLTKTLVEKATKLDRQMLASKIAMPTSYGSVNFEFSNTGMYLPLEMNSAPMISSKSIDRLTFDVESTFDIQKLIESKTGLGILPGYIMDSSVIPVFRHLEWSYKNGQLELGFDLTDLRFPITLIDAIDVQIGASGDDGRRFTGSLGFSSSVAEETLGYYAGAAYLHMHGFFRFPNLTFSGTVDVAYLKAHALTPTGTPQLKIYGVDLDNPDAPTSTAEFDADTLTEGIDWDGAWTNGSSPQSPSIVSICQTLATNYAPSNESIMFQIKNDGGTTERFNDIQHWDEASHILGMQFHLEYTAGGGIFYQNVGGALTSASTLNRMTCKSPGAGAIGIASTVNRMTSKIIGSGTVGLAGALSNILKQFKSVGSGSLTSASILGRMTAKSIGNGAVSIAGAVNRLIKKTIGSGAVGIAGALTPLLLGATIYFQNVGSGAVAMASVLGRKISRAVGSGSLTIASTLGRIISKVVGSGSIGLASTLGRMIAKGVGAGAVGIAGALSSVFGLIEAIGLTLAARLRSFTLRTRSRSLTLHTRSRSLHLPGRN